MTKSELRRLLGQSKSRMPAKAAQAAPAASKRGASTRATPTPRESPGEAAFAAALRLHGADLPPAVRERELRVEGLPLPPSLNNAYIGDGRYRRLKSEGVECKREAARLIAAAAAAQEFRVPERTPLRVTFWFWFARNNRDGSNTPKLIEDAAAEVLGFNDIWVWEMRWVKAIDKDNPRCDMTIEVL